MKKNKKQKIKKYKHPMIISMYSHDIRMTYTCYRISLGYGKKCPDRDDGYNCMRCKYCKVEMPAYDATRMYNVFIRPKEK